MDFESKIKQKSNEELEEIFIKGSDYQAEFLTLVTSEMKSRGVSEDDFKKLNRERDSFEEQQRKKISEQPKSILEEYLNKLGHVKDEESCKKAIKITAWICIAIGLLNLLINPSGDFTYSIIDAFIMFLFGFLIFRTSKTASVLVVIYFIICKLIVVNTMLQQEAHYSLRNTLLISFFILAYLINGVRAVFIWHEKYNKISENQ